MSKQQQFTRLPTESNSSVSQTPAIPMQAITPQTQAPRLSLNASVDSQPHIVHFTSLSPIHRTSISGVVLEEEWPLTEIPQELREAGGTYESSSANNTEANSMRTDWKRSLFLLLEDPSSSKAAFMVNVFVSFSIILSAVLTTVETIPSFRLTSSSVW
ncbi:6207_t:CDS:1 [Racocetra fulgida]|uniref:6207_t:CDS:1 n=1 Tax=Racocetra fulgida TaxID=60492 RepID=A0A9N9FH18_9GLOM|nr:6207_t:CDS:1 [Racocetra fulgida]